MSERDYLADLTTWAMINEIDEPPLDWARLGDIIRGLSDYRRATVTPEQVEAAAKGLSSRSGYFWSRLTVAEKDEFRWRARECLIAVGLSMVEDGQ